MNKTYPIIISVLVIVVVIAFFMPWIKVESQALGFFSKLFGNKKEAQVESISGFRMPIIANSEESRTIIEIMKTYDPNVKEPSKKIYLVWLFPTLALMILLLSLAFPRNNWAHLACGIIAVLVFGFGLYKIKNADLNRLQFMTFSFGPGIWLTLWGYLAICVASLLRFATLSIKRNQ